MTTQATTHDQLTAWLLVATQAALIAGVVIAPGDPAWGENTVTTVIGGAAIATAGVVGLWAIARLGRGLTPSPLPNGAVELVTRGPYRWIRHPIYTAVVIGMGGVALHSRTPAPILMAVVLAVFLAFKARWEERHLRETFDGYEGYGARTGRFVPGVGRLRTDSSQTRD